MKAMYYDSYGGPEVVSPREMPRPEPGQGEVLVRVGAAGITTADWRLRASAFPGGLWLPGRLMFGLFRPRRRVLGGDFAGTVEAVGAGVTRFRPGDRVFGFSMFGAHAEYLTMPETGASRSGTCRILDDRSRRRALDFAAYGISRRHRWTSSCRDRRRGLGSLCFACGSGS